MMNGDNDDPKAVPRIPAAEALRRLYDAKITQLTKYGVPEPERIMVSVDYAVSELQRCAIEPIGEGGIGRLEDDLYRAIGCDRFTGIRYPPEPRA